MGSTDRTLVVRDWNAGLFSNFNGVLNNIAYRLGREGIAAVEVDWRAGPATPEFAYGRPEDGNIWLALFEPLQFGRFPPERIETRTYADFGVTGIAAYAMYKRDDSWRSAYHHLFRRYVIVRPTIAARVESLYEAAMSGHYCICAHIRHAGHSVECPDPIPPVETFIERIDGLLPRGRSWRVFLASDVEQTVAAFGDAFGDRLVVQPAVARASDSGREQLHHDHDRPAIALAEQVLIDCLLLARCDVLLHTTSNVATAAGYVNPELEMVYCETPEQEAANMLRLSSSL